MSTEHRSALVLALLVCGCLTLAWVLCTVASPPFRDWDSRLNDNFFKLRYRIFGPERTIPAIVHVDLSDAMVRSLGMTVCDRTDFARLVNILSRAGVESILFDIIFSEPGMREGDQRLVEACARAGMVYHPVILQPQGYEAVFASPTDTDTHADILWHPQIQRQGEPILAIAAITDFTELAETSRGIGHINSDPDPDGVNRTLPLLIRYRDGWVPSIALRMACDLLSVEPDRIDVAFGRNIRLPDARLPDASVRDIDIPIDRQGRMILNFAGPWADSFSHYSLVKLLEAETDENIAEAVRTELEGSLIIVSDLTTSSGDHGPVPFERVYPLSGIHANVLNSILTARFLRNPHWYESLMGTLTLAAMLWVVSWRLRPLAFTMSAFLCLAGFSAFWFWLFTSRGIMPRLVPPFLGFVGTLIAINGYRFYRAEREKFAFRVRLERYFAPRLMSKILQSPAKLLAAEHKVLTVLFSDIASFTSWCTSQPPEEILRTLNEYFDRMTSIVFEHEGTVDKFIGDGLMAFFGDPLEQPDHVLRAVRAAIAMQQAARELRARWEPEGRLPLRIRIGINTGAMVVGDMGSRRIMAYTVIGSNVNLSQRLESKAPVDGILVSEPVYRALNGTVPARLAGKITAKGITEAFETYEILIP